MNTKHTAGPWHVGMRPGPIIYGPLGEQVADLRGERKTTVIELDEAVANTKLIAAAPELLEILNRILAELIPLARGHFPKSIHNGDKFALENACATIGKAIAKATS